MMAHDFRGQLTTVADVMQYVQAGNARFTLVSKKTGERRTYRMQENDDGKLFFVSVLVGSDNESDYQYLGLLRNGQFERGKKSRITTDSPAFQAFDWFWRRVSADHAAMFESMEVWHEGSCGRCGRTLTVPASIARGFGPECVKHVPARDDQLTLIIGGRA